MFRRVHNVIGTGVHIGECVYGQVSCSACARRLNVISTVQPRVMQTTSATYKSSHQSLQLPGPRPPLTSLAAVLTKTRPCCVRISDRRHTEGRGQYFTAAATTGATVTSYQLSRRGPVTSKVMYGQTGDVTCGPPG